MEFLAATQNAPFVIALGIMLGVALLEGVGTLVGGGLSQLIDGLLPDLDLDVDVDADVDPGGGDAHGVLSRGLGWLHLGRVPFLVWLVLFLTAFGLAGLALQSLAHATLGALLPAVAAAPAAFALALPAVRMSGGLVARCLPQDETSAVSSDHFVGRVATIVLGTARCEKPTQARVRDRHGRSHYVMVEPDLAGEELSQGTPVLLVRRDGPRFRAIRAPETLLGDVPVAR